MVAPAAAAAAAEALPPARLILEDGTVLHGRSFGAPQSVSGECVFSTGMVGYVESLTDPSYAGQLLCLTSVMVGNYGVPKRGVLDEHGLPLGFESDRIHTAAVIVQDYSDKYSHYEATSSLGDWLKEEGVPGICDIDTRALTKRIRDKGAMLARIEIGEAVSSGVSSSSDSLYNPNKDNLVAKVSCKERTVYGKGGDVRILAVDCGCKANIIRCLVERGAEVTVVPFDCPLQDLLEDHDGLFLSNGPGDPTMASQTIEHLKGILSANEQSGKVPKPIFGICLGNQLLSLAAGASTRKLKFGNRGQNQPVRNCLTGDCYVTPQNHGYAVDASTLPAGWKELFHNLNDDTNEGVCHESMPYFTAQFHPEAMCGPTDTSFLFDTFLNLCREKRTEPGPVLFVPRAKISGPPPANIKKVLLLGSGGLSIGQAGEFDYSGSQAIKALKEEGMEVVLMNPNIASVQTNADSKSEFKADHVFFLPVTPEFVEQVLKREKPDGIVVSMGGQTALNCAVKMYHAGTFEKYNVKVLGTPIDAIIATEDRDIFNDKLKEIGEKIAPSEACERIDDAVAAAKRIGFPVMVRAAYALGGLGSGICANEERLRELASKALTLSPQILVEKSLWGWKEVEYEVVRDRADNCITVCNMENFDPLGVHTGDSIVIAPSQTLNNEEYHILRETAIKVVRHLGIVGECNIQYALDPHSKDYCIIEVNARLSRSSALASKATGYPLAFVAAKLALGQTLDRIKNSITKKTVAFFEPSLDYCVTKVPRWDLSKFERVSTQIGSAMKSVGEVMAIGRTWEESMHKAIRMVDPTAAAGFEINSKTHLSKDELEGELARPTDLRVFAIAQAMYTNSLTIDQIHELSKIDRWFLYRLQKIADFSRRLEGIGSLSSLASSPALMREAKSFGFTDKQIAKRVGGGVTELDVRKTRKGAGIRPFVKQIDTLAAEFPAETNYLYLTYAGSEDDRTGKGTEKGGVIVLGSGTYRIGSSVEFDWCGVSAMRTIIQTGKRSIMINYNPETVSTDYDESDLLFFEELSRERVMDVYDLEEPEGVVVSVGGQIPNNLALPLEEAGAVILGTSPSDIDRAEDRHKFSALIDSIGVEQAPWRELTSVEAALAFAKEVSFPVLIRPSYVLSGAAMNVAHDEAQLVHFLGLAAEVSKDYPVVVSKFIMGAREVEMDAVACRGEVIAAATHIHVENAGVHSGDATLLLPPGRDQLSSYSFHRVQLATQAIARALNITGPFNIQFLCKDASCMVIECNCRASRSFPFVSKTMGVDYIEVATRTMLGEGIDHMNAPKLWETGRPRGYVACKVPMFSFTRLIGADPILGVEMASTGEVACFGVDRHEAFLKALLSTGFKMPQTGILISAQESMLEDIVHIAYSLGQLGFALYATKKTHAHLSKRGVASDLLHFPSEAASPNAVDHLRERKIDLVINLPTAESVMLADNYLIRRTAVDLAIPLLTNISIVQLFSDAMARYKKKDLLGLYPDSLFDYYAIEPSEEAWTAPNEFH